MVGRACYRNERERDVPAGMQSRKSSKDSLCLANFSLCRARKIF